MDVATRLAPTSRSVALVVTVGPLLLVALLPTAAALMSTGVVESMPLYSTMRTSGYLAAGENATVTRLAPAAEATMFFA